ncbi:protein STRICTOSIDINE SYNTHASE-LIKE 2 [Gossypium australe]|uniref:Protein STRICTOSIDINE SYNTHASE-LIKE 2 n=1 Tax=Gossypium australe TaxID=47621 RepID=A0A5B6V7U1_9ROSI|nr:protein STRICTOSIDINE SYNTHASE-LIKE 2 [Gossypium australe]
MASKPFIALATTVFFFSLIAVNHFGKPFHGKLGEMEVVPITDAVGPESVAFHPLGDGPYVGISDGRIIKWQPNEHRWISFGITSPNREGCEGKHDHETREHICGRPLGICFHETTGDLYIADAYMGLLKLGPAGGLATPIPTHAQPQPIPFTFTNSLDINQSDGSIYFTHTSSIYHRRNHIAVVLSGDKTGMLLKYEQESKQITVLLTNLSFPNGVALSKDGSFLVFAETTKCRILRYWLSTPKAGNLETLAQLPGFPDNIKRSPRGGFWVAIHSRRCKVLSWILSYSKLGNALIWVLPVDVITKAYSVMSKYLGSGLAMRISEEGVILETLELESGNKMSSISEVQEKDDHLWMGSINMPFLGVYRF